MRLLKHTVLITGDDTDVWGGTIIEDVPDWARHLHIINGFSDYDALIDLEVNRQEYLRQSAPDAFAADNTLVIEATVPHVVCPVDPGREYPVNENFNVVTGGTGLAIAYYVSQ